MLPIPVYDVGFQQNQLNLSIYLSIFFCPYQMQHTKVGQSHFIHIVVFSSFFIAYIVLIFSSFFIEINKIISLFLSVCQMLRNTFIASRCKINVWQSGKVLKYGKPILGKNTCRPK